MACPIGRQQPLTRNALCLFVVRSLADNALCGIKYGRGTYTAEGVNALCEALKSTTTLTSLNLDENQLTGPRGTNMSGILKLAEALPHSQLTSLGCGSQAP